MLSRKSYLLVVTLATFGSLVASPSANAEDYTFKEREQHVRTTAYTHTESDHLSYGRKTAIGTTLKFTQEYTSAAADWSRFPVGTEFRIKGMNRHFVIDDYGSALVGKDTIDLYFPSKKAMNKWGVQHVDIVITKYGDYEKSAKILEYRKKYWHCKAMLTDIQKNKRNADGNAPALKSIPQIPDYIDPHLMVAASIPEWQWRKASPAVEQDPRTPASSDAPILVASNGPVVGTPPLKPANPLISALLARQVIARPKPRPPVTVAAVDEGVRLRRAYREIMSVSVPTERAFGGQAPIANRNENPNDFFKAIPVPKAKPVAEPVQPSRLAAAQMQPIPLPLPIPQPPALPQASPSQHQSLPKPQLRELAEISPALAQPQPLDELPSRPEAVLAPSKLFAQPQPLTQIGSKLLSQSRGLTRPLRTRYTNSLLSQQPRRMRVFRRIPQ